MNSPSFHSGDFKNFKKVNSVNLSQISLLNMWLLVQIRLLEAHAYCKVTKHDFRLSKNTDVLFVFRRFECHCTHYQGTAFRLKFQFLLILQYS